MITHLNLTFGYAEPPQWKEFIQKYPKQYKDNGISCPVELTPERYRLMCAIHHHINVATVYKKDKDEDTWDITLEAPMVGDCEDISLSKRACLLEAGFPYGSLWPTICLREGKGHMVLVVHTSKMDWVLDTFYGTGVQELYKSKLHWIAAYDGRSWRHIIPKWIK